MNLRLRSPETLIRANAVISLMNNLLPPIPLPLTTGTNFAVKFEKLGLPPTSFHEDMCFSQRCILVFGRSSASC